jgi:hypothetical protein
MTSSVNTMILNIGSTGSGGAMAVGAESARQMESTGVVGSGPRRS